MSVPIQRIDVKYAVVFYLVFFPAGVAFGSLIGILLLNLPWYIGVSGSAIFALVFGTRVGKVLFTRIEFTERGVTLISPFKRLVLARSDVASVDLRLRSPNEEAMPFHRQVAVLHVVLTNGRRLEVGMLEVKLLRAIASRLTSSAGPAPRDSPIDSFGSPAE